MIHKIRQLLKENVEENLCDLELGIEFFEMVQKAQFIRKKTDTLNFIKVKSFCSLKDTAKRTKTLAAEWEKMFANHIADKGLV